MPDTLDRSRSIQPPDAAEPSTLTPGGYLRRRREAQGLSVDDAGNLYAHDVRNRTAARLMIAQWEADELIASDTGLNRLRLAYRFEPHVYRQLIDGLPTPQLCRTCACSWFDPCDDQVELKAGQRTVRGCAWTAEDPTLCTACATSNGSPSR